MVPPPGYRSPTVSCLHVPAGRGGPEITAAMAKRGFTIASGYGALKDATIRIGHMGDHTVAELDVLLEALAAELGA
jgi:aspartate aminotransferase-like enzyme